MSQRAEFVFAIAMAHHIEMFQPQRPARTLRCSMVLTVEPGIYVRAAEGVPEQFHNIGIRIEDDAIVTDTGCELISRDVPVKVVDIEALMRV